MSVHRIIKTIRNHLGLSQEEFAVKIGTSRSNLGQIETGKSNPTVEIVLQIVNIFHIDANIFALKDENDALKMLHSQNAQFRAQFSQNTDVPELRAPESKNKPKESLEAQVKRLEEQVKEYRLSVDRLNVINTENSMELLDRIFKIDEFKEEIGQMRADIKAILSHIQSKNLK